MYGLIAYSGAYLAYRMWTNVFYIYRLLPHKANSLWEHVRPATAPSRVQTILWNHTMPAGVNILL